MGQEIERKFLVRNDTWRRNATGTHYRQGYSVHRARTDRARSDRRRPGHPDHQGKDRRRHARRVRVRHPSRGSRAVARYALPAPTHRESALRAPRWVPHMGDRRLRGRQCRPRGRRDRAPSEDEAFERPHWLGEEVTHDAHYFNASLVQNPYRPLVESLRLAVVNIQRYRQPCTRIAHDEALRYVLFRGSSAMWPLPHDIELRIDCGGAPGVLPQPWRPGPRHLPAERMALQPRRVSRQRARPRRPRPREISRAAAP